jgi:hypothetical protein
MDTRRDGAFTSKRPFPHEFSCEVHPADSRNYFFQLAAMSSSVRPLVSGMMV